jgi:hypothetical protein
MLSLNVSKRDLDLTQYRTRRALPGDCSRHIAEDCFITVDCKPTLAYIHRIDGDFTALRAALDTIKYSEAFRASSSAIFTRARIFGYAPRIEMRNRPCRKASLSIDQPNQEAILEQTAGLVWQAYRTTFPERATSHLEQASKVLPDYLMAGTPFTSGIVNANNPLPYHFDRGNFKGVNSAMLGFKRDIEGGHLCIPEIDISLEIGDQSLLLFDGQSLIHGVTPFKRMSETAMRYTIVFYSLVGMWRCETPEAEVRHFNRRRTDAERQRSKAIRDKQ